MMYLVAEYCASDFFMGWWLYLRETNDGRPNRGREWGWLRDSRSRKPARRLCTELGGDPPEDSRYSQGFAEWFAATYPNGLRVEMQEWRYKLAEICARRPRERRHAVRTIRGAELADRARIIEGKPCLA